MKINIGKAAKELGVTVQTIRVWEKEGKIKSERTEGGHRRYDLNELLRLKDSRQKIKTEDKKALIYARVSTRNKKNDLERQKNVLELFCAAKGWKYTILEDIGSGLNYEKKGLKELIRMIETNQIHTLVLNYKDRLLRYGSEIIFEMCRWHNIDVIILNDEENKTYEEELVEDVLSIITVFSAKLYGSRSHKNKKIIETNEHLFQ
ncbi:IS607 family transposase [Bacillus mobilis]|uniref:IS607 family transposase n=1 Tax=Bacillus mobilis TaxID=2026190 RepID=UPI0008FE8651|nr:IS607 family transposase [Bacillus mobilis]OJE32416.1 transposase [Bacillus mobilis]HDR7243175.1 IS607 family transposase [Bacillus mobilis]HDR7244978.1 IS607 family transposase [Bacillus mobilis]